MKNKIYIISLLILAVVAGYFIYRQNNKNIDPVVETEVASDIKVEPEKVEPEPETVKSETKPVEQPKSESSVPKEYSLKMDFVSQAPFANWDELHEEACEEASIINIHYYKQKKKLDPGIAEMEIQKMVAYVVNKYGSHKDLTAVETVLMAKDLYGYKNSRILDDFKWEDIKQEISNGNPVIVPAAGQLLGNPYFKQPGPVYHMFVIKGYTEKELVTNEVGTKRGDGYRYSYSILDKAVHDWTGSYDTILSGKRTAIVLE